jgi:hypothetical protein
MPHNLVQIDKQRRTEHPVEFFLARRVPSHQALEGSRLVGRIVVDVHAGKLGPARYGEVDKVLEAALLIDTGKPPAMPLCELSVILREKVTEQKFEAVLSRERVTL